jgi:hypothetical protein
MGCLTVYEELDNTKPGSIYVYTGITCQSTSVLLTMSKSKSKQVLLVNL